MVNRRTSLSALAALGAALLASCNGNAGDGVVAAGPEAQLGLFTTLPVFWNETPDVAALLDAQGEQHWARTLMTQQYDLVPLVVLSEDRLAGLEQLVLAQPRPLSPQENVALDDWVRAGGQVLVFADPMLMQHSIFPLGDKRRPQDVVLLSPILARWGLELVFDEEQDAGERTVRSAGIAVPVVMAGQLAATQSGAESQCDISEQDLVARCRIGEGTATIVADADLFEPHAESDLAPAALNALMQRAFAD